MPPTAQGPAENFTGDVWFDVIAAGVRPSRLRVSTVRFSPGAHTAWHRHANGQTLHQGGNTELLLPFRVRSQVHSVTGPSWFRHWRSDSPRAGRSRLQPGTAGPSP
jgi:hypothetical protein